MKRSIHPIYTQITVTCNSCSAKYQVGSTLSTDMRVDVCDKCHPFFTGTQKIVDVANKARDFQKRSDTAKKLQEKIAQIKAEKSKRQVSSSNDENVPMTLKDMMKLLKQGDKN